MTLYLLIGFYVYNIPSVLLYSGNKTIINLTMRKGLDSVKDCKDIFLCKNLAHLPKMSMPFCKVEDGRTDDRIKGICMKRDGSPFPYLKAMDIRFGLNTFGKVATILNG